MNRSIKSISVVIGLIATLATPIVTPAATPTIQLCAESWAIMAIPRSGVSIKGLQQKLNTSIKQGWQRCQSRTNGETILQLRVNSTQEADVIRKALLSASFRSQFSIGY